MKYGQSERWLGNLLKRYPRIFQLIKFLYQLMNYIWFHRKLIEVNRSKVRVEVDPHSYGANEAFFGYYDRQPVDRLGNILSVLVFSDGVYLCVVSKTGEVVWKEKLRTYNYQQGCLASWVGDEKFIFNSVIDGWLRGILVDLGADSRTILEDSFQSFGNGYFSSINTLRVNQNRPEYGYTHYGKRDIGGSLLRVSKLSDQKLLWDISEAVLAEKCGLTEYDAIKVNHVIFSPDGGKFLFLVRWFVAGVKKSALLCGEVASRDLKVLIDSGVVSHYCWLDGNRYVVWGRKKDGGDGYFLGDVFGLSLTRLSVSELSQGDGHPSRIDNKSFVSDTYPDRAGSITLYIKDVELGEQVLISLGVPFFPRGAKRTDFHPRYVASEGKVYFDSNHLGRRCICSVDVALS